MFGKLCDTDFNDRVNKNAEILIKKDRMKFLEVYKVVENYCKDTNIVLSDIEKLTNENKTNFKYELYCESAYKHANNLANLIHKNVGEWVKLKTIVEYQEFIIEYDMRPLICIYNLKNVKNVTLHNLILPVKIDDIFYMSPEMEIIEIYHKLYSPNFADEWENLIHHEIKLYSMIEKRISKGIFGGKKPKKDIPDLKYLKYLVLSEFCGEFVKNYTVIGQWALDLIEKGKNSRLKLGSVEKLQLITSTDVDKSIEDITNFLKMHTNNKIIYQKQDLRIPNDFRTNRYTIYIEIGRGSKIKKKAIIDIFDCGTFELIPYVPVSVVRSNKSNKSKDFVVRVGNPFVLLRFLMIDIWIIRVINKLGFLNDRASQNKTKYILSTVKKIKSSDMLFINNAFGVDYVGVYKDYFISKKINNLSGKAFYPYYPERYLAKNGRYRHIN